MTRVAVLLGGRSNEREVSLRTGRAVAEALRRKGHDVTEVDAVGDWVGRLLSLRPEAVFVALHGRWGEDGTVQGLLEMLDIPYTGSGVLASALAMDKVASKRVFEACGIPTPPWQVLPPGQGAEAVEVLTPLVAKPPRGGSTLGVGVARTPGEVPAALDVARGCEDTVLIEGFIEGRELTVGILDDLDLPVVEIVPDSGFYDYEAKYTAGRTRYLCPAPLAEVEASRSVEVARAAYAVLGCSGAARVDLRLDPQGNPWVLEVNTIPGMTPTSLLPKAAAAAGIGFDDLVERMLSGASLKA
ncbi:MAG: D-alanine--D-alanine ligase [Deltaproteobacteria bacterium]|nr:D-alanine--D-alanine ligase [Deltaproteobacteria bacterium]